MFHLLTTISDAHTFPMRRVPSPEAGGDFLNRTAQIQIGRPNGMMPATSRPRQVGIGPAHATAWLKPLLCCGLLSVALLVGGVATSTAAAQSTQPPSRAAKITNALTAAPEEITRNASVKDWPAKEGEGLTLLRQGTNGWVCLPNDPATPGNDPMCMDETFHSAVAAFFSGQPAKLTRVGFAYMLTSDAEGSNIDPKAQGPTATNQWHHAGPHVMVLYPDAKLLEGVPTKPTEYGPYVMFPGTPIAHVMLPVASGYAHASSHSSGQKRAKQP